MITIGLDFGTHQSKVCAEHKNRAELSYTFFTFPDTAGKPQYTLPSIIHLRPDGRMDYGYIPTDSKGEIVRYFKQATFTTSDIGLKQPDAMYYSVWYLAFILFDLEEINGKEFSIQMGVPTDGARFTQQKELAVRLLSAAYTLVEVVFENDKQAFLNKTWAELKDMTKIPDYSDQLKEYYEIRVFPEAYACLRPLVTTSKIAAGMSLMVDIGGGTTDISFFTIDNNKKQPLVYHFSSINKGLNYLTKTRYTNNDRRTDSNVISASEIDNDRLSDYEKELKEEHKKLLTLIKGEFKSQSDFTFSKLWDALKKRPIIYAGGGSTFEILRKQYYGFIDVINVSQKEWDSKAVVDMCVIENKGLCPILQTAYGLSIHAIDDELEICSIKKLFPTSASKNLRTDSYDRSPHDDWDAVK